MQDSLYAGYAGGMAKPPDLSELDPEVVATVMSAVMRARSEHRMTSMTAKERKAVAAAGGKAAWQKADEKRSQIARERARKAWETRRKKQRG